METWATANEEQARYRDGGKAAHWLAHKERFVCWQNLAGNGWIQIVVPGAAAARRWRSHPPVIRPLRDRARWAIAAGLPPCCVPRCSAGAAIEHRGQRCIAIYPPGTGPERAYRRMRPFRRDP